MVAVASNVIRSLVRTNKSGPYCQQKNRWPIAGRQVWCLLPAKKSGAYCQQQRLVPIASNNVWCLLPAKSLVPIASKKSGAYFQHNVNYGCPVNTKSIASMSPGCARHQPSPGCPRPNKLSPVTPDNATSHTHHAKPCTDFWFAFIPMLTT